MRFCAFLALYDLLSSRFACRRRLRVALAGLARLQRVLRDLRRRSSVLVARASGGLDADSPRPVGVRRFAGLATGGRGALQDR